MKKANQQNMTGLRRSLVAMSMLLLTVGVLAPWLGGCGVKELGMGRFATTVPAMSNDGFPIDPNTVRFCARPVASSQSSCVPCAPSPAGFDCTADLAPGDYAWKVSLEVQKGTAKIPCSMNERFVTIEAAKVTSDTVQLTCTDGSAVQLGRLEVCVEVDTTNAPGSRCAKQAEPSVEPPPQDAGTSDTKPAPNGCLSDADCTSQQVCVGGMCIAKPPTPTGCHTDADCGAGEFCDKGGNCQANPTNPPGGCSSDADCPSGERCTNGVCTAPPLDCQAACSGMCGTLPNGCTCSSCQQPWVCGTNNQCTCPLMRCGTECVDTKTSMNHCGACGTPCSQFCVNGACVACRTNSDCGASMACQSGRCVATGPVCGNGRCDTGENCSSCPQDCPCDNGRVCRNNYCALPCSYSQASQSYPGAGTGGVRGGEIFDIKILSVTPTTGRVCFEVRKKDGSLMSSGRTYELRVTGEPNQGCRDYNVVRRVWYGGATNFQTCEDILAYSSGQMTKYFCFSARTRSGDPGYDPSNLAQQAWWYSPLVGVTRTSACP